MVPILTAAFFVLVIVVFVLSHFEKPKQMAVSYRLAVVLLAVLVLLGLAKFLGSK